MPRALIGLGSNLGDREQTLRAAVAELGVAPDARLIAVSPWFETAPTGGPPGQGAFLNGAALVETALSPDALLGRLLQLENSLGRSRQTRWGPRTIDLDLLLFDEEVCRTSTLELPHPRLAVRRFVLEPAATIAGSMVDPRTGWTIGRLFEHLRSAVPYVALVGVPGAGKSRLAETVAAKVSAESPILLDHDATDTGDRPGSGVDVELEFVRARRKRLTRCQWGPQRMWQISDFWIEQSLAYARIGLSEAEQAAVAKCVDEAKRAVVGPKLLVYLEEPRPAEVASDGSPLSIGGAEREQAMRMEALAPELSRLAHRPGVGPVLRLRGADQATSAMELAAALQSMQ